MNLRRACIALTLSLVALGTPALLARQPQAGGDTEIYLANLAEIKAHGPNAPVTLVNISKNPDYDNQPSFTPDSKAVLFSSRRDGRQDDIYRFDIAAKTLTQVTHTPENENSPVVTPDGRALSVVRTEKDQTQRLWRFNLDGSSPQVILDKMKAAYYAWIDATHVALCVPGASGRPATLQIADTATGDTKTIDSDIGRTLAIRPSTGALTYISKKDPGWSVMELRSDRTLVPLSLGTIGSRPTEDIVWDPSSGGGRFIAGDDGVLFSATLNDNTATRAPFVAIRSLADLSSSHIHSITRLAISPDAKWIAIVAEPVSK